MIVDCLAHVHSSLSYDSPTDLADVAAIARRTGIGCVLMSEHNNTLDSRKVAELVARCRDLSSESCLLVPGLELSLDENRVHVLAYGVREYIASPPGLDLAPLVQRIHQLGGIAVLAHPAHKTAWRRVNPEDLHRLDGVEIWNVKNASRLFPHADDVALVRSLRQSGVRVAAFAGLDWHHLAHFERLVLRLEVDRLEAPAVLSQLRLGQFSIHGRYASFRQDSDLGVLKRTAYLAATRTVLPLRRKAYVWQARLKRSGVGTPRALAKVARRILS